MYYMSDNTRYEVETDRSHVEKIKTENTLRIKPYLKIFRHNLINNIHKVH